MASIFDASVPCSAFKTHVANHADIKQSILAALNKNWKGFDTISRTDWETPINLKDYPAFVFDQIHGHIQEVANKLELGSYRLSNFWFQQYKTTDWHGWHVHPYAMFGGVYYVELPTSADGTLFKHMGKEFIFETVEGDIISFPTFLKHASRPNTSNFAKTVIAFNYDVF